MVIAVAFVMDVHVHHIPLTDQRNAATQTCKRHAYCAYSVYARLCLTTWDGGQ